MTAIDQNETEQQQKLAKLDAGKVTPKNTKEKMFQAMDELGFPRGKIEIKPYKEVIAGLARNVELVEEICEGK